MEKPLVIANEFIRLACSAEKPPTQMKLQKLIFFAHGWHLALYDSPLVKEGFEAWKYGPVIPSVYHEFKNFGVLGITREGTEMEWRGEGIFWVVPKLNDQRMNAFLQRIWDVFGKFTGTQLSAMTHAPSTPWTNARVGHNDDDRNIPIDDDKIKKYFKEMIPRHA